MSIVTIPTGSQMDRIARCPASAALPQVRDANDNAARDRGTAMHKFLERVPVVGREAALEEVDEQHREFCADIEIAALADRLSLSLELALAYDWKNDTARILQPLEHRAYEVDETCEIPLTLDVAGVAGRTVYAGDFKSGHGWLPEPHQSMQLGLGALALARLHRARSAHVEYLRIRSDGSARRFAADMDVFGLEGAAERVRAAMQDVEATRARIGAGHQPDVLEGPWCRYCPARAHCPAKVALIRSVLHDPPAISMREAITPDNAANVYAMVRRAKDAIAMADAALYAYAKTTPIPLGVDEDGSLRFFGELRRPGNDVVDGAIAHRVLTKHFGGEAANQAVTMETTKKAITDVARKNLKEGDKITRVVKSLVDEIKAAGGIDNPETCTTVEYTVDAEGAAKARKRKAS